MTASLFAENILKEQNTASTAKKICVASTLIEKPDWKIHRTRAGLKLQGV
jgi:hypothetical protein